MKNHFFRLLACLITVIPWNSLNAQIANSFQLGLQTNLDVYKPYSSFGKEFNKKYNNVSSFTYSVYGYYSIVLDNKQSFGLGFSLKRIQHKIVNKFDYQINVVQPPFGSNDTVIYYSPTTLYSKSTSIGAYFEFNRIIHAKKKRHGILGIATQLYFLEFFKSHYDLHNEHSGLDDPIPMLQSTPRNFFFSSANASLSYALEFMDEKSVSFRLKASLGTNLYSDWDQFSKYVWIGVGGEFGIPFRKKGHAISTSSKVK
jgi:hypothetical protein